MKAIHSCWTKPFFVRGGKDFFMEDFDILTTILSALVWRKNGGSISMLTDEAGAEYFASRKIDSIWNGGVLTPLTDIPSELDPFLFWAGGKLWALKSLAEPAAMIDTDMIVWKNMDYISDSAITVAHREEINPAVYPDISYFKMKEGYAFPSLDWSIAPCNTAFLYISDMDFKNHYISRAMDFMLSLKEADSVVIPMVFAEQRMLSMCAAEKGLEIHSLLDQYNLNSQDFITHVWGFKSQMRQDKQKRSQYCRRCIDRISQSFPEFEEHLWNIPEIINHLSF